MSSDVRLLEFLRVDPSNQALRRQCVDAALAAGHFDVVAQAAELALAGSPMDPGALYDKATGLMGLKSYRAALALLGQVASIAGPDPAIALNQGLCHYCLGEFEQARPYLDSCYAAGDRSAGLLRLLISSYHHLGAVEDAVKIARENEPVGKTDGAVAGVFAMLFLDAGDSVRASRWAKTALELNPGSIDGRVTEATLLTARMQTDRAEQMLEGVLRDAPLTGRAWIGLGTLSLLTQHMDRAKQQLQRGVELMPGHVGSWHVLGWAQLMSGDPAAAELSFQQAMELDRNFSETHGSLAVIAATRGDIERAKHSIDVALRLDPNCLSAKYAQAQLLSRSGGAAQGEKLVSEAVLHLADADGSALSKLLLKGTKH